jgi:hypothetical protein
MKWDIIHGWPPSPGSVANFVRHGKNSSDIERYCFSIVGWAIIIVYKTTEEGSTSHNEVRPLVQFPDSPVARPVFKEDGLVSTVIDGRINYQDLDWT